MLIQATFEGETSATPLDLDPNTTSVSDLYDAVKCGAAARLEALVDVSLVHAGHLIPRSDEILSTLGISEQAVVHAVCRLAPSVPSIYRCEPLMGPVGGGTVVRIHGDGFLLGRGFERGTFRIGFGQQIVPCKRAADDMLVCTAPPHGEGIVTVRLLCANGMDQEHSSACTFEYVRLEAMYDLIFAKTNSFCPQRTVRDRSVDPQCCEDSDGDNVSQPRQPD